MTDLKRSVFVIPSSALEDLPTRMGHELATDFLCAWTAQWDPRLLCSMATLPEWKKPDSSSLDLSNSLVVCPDISQAKMDVPLREQLQSNQCTIVDSRGRLRPVLVNALLDSVGQSSVLVPQSNDADQSTNWQMPLLVEDFYALGYAVLQIQILARKLRYSWNIDWIMFTEQVLSAARASLAQDPEETERWLQASFDSLSQERDRYCSQQAYLLDVVLMAPTALGQSLDRQLETKHPFNLIATSALLGTLKTKNEKAWSILCQKLADNTCSLVGGLETERPHSYLSSSAIFREFNRGLSSYVERGISPPKVFTRFEPGFLASLPNWLTQFGFSGALVAAWSGGTIPDKDQAKIRWQASEDGKSIDTVLGFVLDAASSDSYIDLAVKLSGQLDYHHIPTVIFAHWPGIQSVAWNDLQRVLARSPALGKFHTADDYFATTTQPYSSDSFPSHAFRIAVPAAVAEQQQLHARLAGYEQIRSQVERLWSLHHLWRNVANQRTQTSATVSPEQQEISELLAQLDSWYDSGASRAELPVRLDDCKAKLMDRVRRALASTKSKSQTSDSVVSASDRGYLLVNPSNHPQRAFLKDIPGVLDIESCSRIFASESESGNSNLVVDIPSFGFVRFRTKQSASFKSNGESKSLSKPSFWKRVAGARSGIAQSDWTLANEFMEIQIDPKRGHLRSVFIANKRGSHMSGMASLVRGPADAFRKWDDTECLDLLDIRLRLVESSQLVGVIEVTGTAKNADGSMAHLTTRYTLWKGARWVEIEVLAENVKSETCGCVWRTAWQNEAAIISAWYQGIKGKLQGPFQGSVELIEIDDADHRICIAPRGLAAHRRSGNRFLISQLPIQNDGTVKSRFSIGLDWPRAYETAIDQCDSPWIIEELSPSGAVSDAGAWLAQCNLSHVSLSWDDVSPTIEPCAMPAEVSESWEGQRADACIWLREMRGKFGTAKLSFFRNVAQAWRVDFQGREFDTLTVESGQIVVPVQANEQCRILLLWETTSNEANAS